MTALKYEMTLNYCGKLQVPTWNPGKTHTVKLEVIKTAM